MRNRENLMESFVLIEGKDKGYEKENSWFHLCGSKSIPFIKVTKRTRFADVHWDYITFSTELDPNWEDSGIRMFAMELHEKFITAGSSADASNTVVTIKNIEHENASEIANRLYTFIDTKVQSWKDA